MLILGLLLGASFMSDNKNTVSNVPAPSKIYKLIQIDQYPHRYNEEQLKTIAALKEYRKLTVLEKRKLLSEWANAVSVRHSQLVNMYKKKRFGHLELLKAEEYQCDLSKLDLFLMIDGYDPIFHSKVPLETIYNVSTGSSKFSVQLLDTPSWPKKFNGIRYATPTTNLAMCSFDPGFSSKSLRVLKWLSDGESFEVMARRSKVLK